MKKQNELRNDRFRGRYSEKQLHAGEGGGGQSVPIMTVDGGHPGRLAARPLLSLVVSLLLAVVMLAAPVASPAQVSVGVSVTFGPPAIPVYVQPPIPEPGFIWVPGYWAWDSYVGAYYWVPGIWVPAPFVGALWTPGYWAWNNGVFIWYDGYWGPVVGFYGGINYGYGYTGYGYAGGYWSGGRFYYNRTVNNISVTNITNVYSQRVSNVRPAGVSFNGGPGGTTARPSSEQLAAARQRRSSLTFAQTQQMQAARANPNQRATINHGRPAVAATTKPGVFTGRGVTGASRAGAQYKVPPERKAEPSSRAGTQYKVPQGRKAEPRESVRTPKPGTEMRPPGIAPEHMAPGTPRVEHERQINEPRPAPQRPETKEPSQKKEKPKDEKEEPR